MGAGAVAVDGPAGYAHLLDPNRTWRNNKRLIILNAWITLLLITSSTNGFDGSMMNGLQALPQWQSAFNHPGSSMLGLLNAIQNVGALVALPFAPYLSDGMGRRPSVIFGAGIMVVGTVLQTASQSVGMFIGARLLIGFGLTFASNGAAMLITELAYPSYRATQTSLFNSLWYSGAIIAAWSTFGTFKINSSWSWRIPSALQGIPSILQLALLWFGPESPRWLMSKGREAEALQVLAYYHADGNKEDPLVQFEYEEIKAAIDLDRAVADTVGWMSLINTPGNRKRLTIVVAIAWFSQWSGNGLVSYYLNQVFETIGITDPTVQLLINGILQIWNLAWAVSAAALVERIGRRTLFITSCVGMLLFFTLQTVCSARYAITKSDSAAHAVIAFIFLFYASYDIAFTPLIVSYTLEILPYPLRAKGFTVFAFVISLALIFNQYVNPVALRNIGWKYYIVYCCWLAFELFFCYMFIVETKGHSLEETAALFDGDDAVDQIYARGRPSGNEKDIKESFSES
ncbi:hexose transporter [Thelephora terrestris]|uniref:Hexose transporter n=1 Tax=Thelephora terrestris TaxID=56493 RepID=A0A9P6HIM5_9AGAM|nr:hexose transporter [Thelephora terrestris]